MNTCDYEKLIYLLTKFLDGNLEGEKIYEFTWEIIDLYSKKKRHKRKNSYKERVFWNTIWFLQHILDEEHLKNDVIRKKIRHSLKYLIGSEMMPNDYIGEPP